MSAEMDDEILVLVSRLILARGNMDEIKKIIAADFDGIRNTKAANRAGAVLGSLLVVMQRVLDSHPHRDFYLEHFRVRNEFDSMTKDIDNTTGSES